MAAVLASSWALLLGVFLVMIGNGIQGSLLGVRGDLEGFSTGQMSLIMSGYFVGLLAGSRLIPRLLAKVGHVRVYGAIGGMIAAVLLLYPLLPSTPAWLLLRVVIGFAFAGVYITSESWLNSAVRNTERGKAMSLYMLAQMSGIIAAQGLLYLGDPSGMALFMVVAILASMAFIPLLLRGSASPSFDKSSPLRLAELMRISPLAVVGSFLLGGIFAVQFSMVGVWGTRAGLSVGQLSLFVAMVYFGALVVQIPLGWISDRMDRRRLVLLLSVIGAASGLLGSLADGSYPLLLLSGSLLGAMANALYPVLLAHANDAMTPEQMPSASAGFILLNGLGAILGPILSGWMMEAIGLWAYFFFMATLFAVLAIYALWRRLRRDRAELAARLS